MRQVLAITGVSGLIGRRVLHYAAASSHWDEILGLDIHFGAMPDVAAFEPVQCDVSRPFARLFQQRGVTAAIHLVFQVDPRHDVRRMQQLNVGGCENFLQACAQADVRAAVVVSSATAYGARSDNPPRLNEDCPLRAEPAFPYAWHKVQTERLCAAFADEHPNVRLAVARPCVVVGPRLDNYLGRMMLRPVVFGARGDDPPMQLVHEQDVARAIVTLLGEQARGAYNVAPADTVHLADVARCLGRPLVRLPPRILAAITAAAWRLRCNWISEVPAGFLDYIRYSWCVNNERLTDSLGFRFQYSTREALVDWQRSLVRDRHESPEKKSHPARPAA